MNLFSKLAAPLIAALALTSANATTGTATAGTINALRVGYAVGDTLFTITGVTTAGTCTTAALDGSTTLVVWMIPYGSGTGTSYSTGGTYGTSGNNYGLTQAQLEYSTQYDRLWGDVKSAQLTGASLIINWDDSKTLSVNGTNYCYPVYVQ